MSRDRWVQVRGPAYDCISVRPCKWGSDECFPGSGGSHGRHSVELAWYVRDDTPWGLGVVQFLVYTGWMLDDTPDSVWGHPMAADLGFHWPVARYEGQYSDSCSMLPGGACFYDGSLLPAEHPWHLLRHKGDAALWSFLDAYFDDLIADGVAV